MSKFSRVSGYLVLTLFVLACLDIFFVIPLKVYGVLLSGYVLFLLVGSFRIQAGVFASVVTKINTKEKVVALTFDDGPDPATTPELLKVLKDHQVQVTFFCIGKYVARHHDLVRALDADGHLVAMHSHSHDYLYDFRTGKSVTDDLNRNAEAIHAAIGKYPRWFRPPYGVTNPAIGRVVRAMALDVIGWSVRSFDTVFPTSALPRIMRRVMPGSIILMHDKLKSAPELALAVIQALRTNGYRIERLDRLIDQQPYR